MVTSTDTHSYDGILDAKILPVMNLSLPEKLERFNDILEIAKRSFNPTSLMYLQEIISSTGHPSNIDHSNNLVADDLLALCWDYHRNPDFMLVLESQLEDMRTGFCPQGRTHRLYQTLLAFT